eukprot:gene484-29709_t
MVQPMLATVTLAAGPASSLTGLTLVPQQPRGAACLDGTAPGYWMEAGAAVGFYTLKVVAGVGTRTNVSALLVTSGGASRAKGGLGSSKSWGASTSCYGSCDGILSKNCTENPDFCNYNHVFIGYCDGSSFSGRRDGAHDGLMYRGRPNLDAVLDSLISKGLGNAKNVVFTGGSAGGLTTYLQVDHVRSRLPNVPTVKGLGDAGWFLDTLTWDGVNASRAEFAYAYNMWNSSTGVNDACITANGEGEEWKCIFAQYAYDSWQMGNILKLPCHNCAAKCTASGCPAGAVADCCGNTTYTEKFLEYGVQMKASISAAVAAKPAGMAGAFVSGCIVHCQTIFNEGEDRWDHWKVGGKKPREVFHSFYFAGHDGRDGGSNGGVGGVGGSDAVAIDADVYPQNPSCPIWT